MPCAVIDTPDTTIDLRAPGNTNKVIVRTIAFSVNYRDRALILAVALRTPPNAFFPIGSDFVARVEAVGPNVRTLVPGDRVIPNCAYPDSGVPGVRPGIPVNSASKELQAFHEAKLVKIPDAMTDDVAAAFSIGGQTAFSMVRRARIRPGERILITGGTSNTSLFLIRALGDLARAAWVITGSAHQVSRLRALGVADVLHIDRSAASFAEHPVVADVVRTHGGFDVVCDPYLDVNLVAATEVMRPGGRYLSCGVADQHSHLGLAAPAARSGAPSGATLRILMGNLEILGNCLGSDDDLRRAMAAHAAGAFPVSIDSVFGGRNASRFLDRSYNAVDRFGKVVFRYAEAAVL